MLSILFLLLGVFIVHLIYEYLKRKTLLDKINEKYILITGCDSGFGNAVSRKLDKLGCHVFAGCYSDEGQEALRKACSSRLHTVPLDVTKEDSIKQALDYVSKNLPLGEGT